MEATTKPISQMNKAEIEEYLSKLKAEELKKEAENKKALSELQDDFINKFIDLLIERHDSVRSLVTEMFQDFEMIKPLKAEVRGAKIAEQFSHTFTSSNKDKSITIGYNYTPAFDGSEAEGITIIKNHLNTLAADDPKLILANKLINLLLKTNPKTGELNVSKALELNAMRADFNSPEFNRGMDILLTARYNKITSSFVSGWKHIEIDGRISTLKFRFSV
jgi:hypothetical protein